MPENERENNLIFGRNAVTEFLKSGGRADTLYLAEEDTDTNSYLVALAKQSGAAVKHIHPKKLEAMCGNNRTQGVALAAALVEYASLEDILARAREKNEPPFILIADGIDDPRNLGAIIRTAECAGVHGLVIPKRGGCAVTPAVFAGSSGAAAWLPVARVPNLASAIRELKEQGIFVYCADMDGVYCAKADLTGAIALVVGSEGAGVSRLVKELCDGVVALPVRGKVNSLNASVAAGALIYEILRQRLAKQPE